MNKFMPVASFILVLIVGGWLLLFISDKPGYSETSNLPIRIGGYYSLWAEGTGWDVKILSLPDSSGWMKTAIARKDQRMGWEGTDLVYYMNINNIVRISWLDSPYSRENR